MKVPADLTIEIRNQQIVLSSGGRSVVMFAHGPISWERLSLAYLQPALAQFEVKDDA